MEAFETSPPRFPTRYRHIGFWIARSALAIVGGLMAVAYNIQSPLLAINIGAATPAILRALAQGFKSQSS